MRRAVSALLLAMSTAMAVAPLSGCASMEAPPPSPPPPAPPPPPPPPPPPLVSQPAPQDVYREIAQPLPAGYQPYIDQPDQVENRDTRQNSRRRFSFQQLAYDGSGRIYCDILSRWTTSGNCIAPTEELVSASADQNNQIAAQALKTELRNAIAAFDPPREMTEGVSETVKLVFGFQQDGKALDPANVERRAQDGDNPVSEGIEVGRWTCARLIVEGFQLPDKDETQCFNSGGRNRYRLIDWKVIPGDSGQGSLKVEIISYDRKGGEIVDSIPSDTINVRIKITSATFFDRLRSFLLSFNGVLVALATIFGTIAVIYWRIKQIGKKPDSGAPEITPATT